MQALNITFIIIPFLLLVAGSTKGQDRLNRGSATGDQHSTLSISDSLYMGGNGNGFNNAAVILALAVTDSLYNGGIANGADMKAVNALILGFTDSLYNGGNGDGTNNATASLNNLGLTDSLYNGGTGNGFYKLTSTSNMLGTTDSVYNGGDGRGEKVATATLNFDPCGTTISWNGSISNEWHQPFNWECGAVPGITTNVIIPSGLTRYPVVFISTEIRKLTIRDGASVTVKQNINFKINGAPGN